MLQHHLREQQTNFRKAVRPNIRIAAYLIHDSGAAYEATGAKLVIGKSTIPCSVQKVATAIVGTYIDAVSFSVIPPDIKRAMVRFKKINLVPYCVGAMDVTHLKWLSHPHA